LDKTFFQDKIIAKKDQPELQDASNFIRHIKGLRISVAENDGYLFQFSPNDMELIMYYKYDKTENGVTTKTPATYAFALGSANTHIGQYQYDRAGSTLGTAAVGDRLNGDEKLFAQGMGGPSIGIRFPESTIAELKKLYEENKAAIISAKIRLYTDASWNNGYAKPTAFTFVQKYISSTAPNTTVTNFTNDVLNLAGSNNYTIYKTYDLDKNPAYYDFIVTKSLKDIVEPKSSTETDTETKNPTKYFRIDMGAFQTNSAGTGLAGYQFTTTPYSTSRAVFVGSKTSDANKATLRVIYGTK